MYRFMIKEDLTQATTCPRCEHATIAGEALNPEVFHQLEKATGLKLMEGFGQSETHAGDRQPGGHGATRVGSMGKAGAAV